MHAWRESEHFCFRYFSFAIFIQFIIHFKIGSAVIFYGAMDTSGFHECEVARTDKSYSEHALCTYLTPSPTNQALYLCRAVQIRLRTILSFIQSYKIQTLNIFFSQFLITIIFICMYSLRYKKKWIPLFSVYDSITFNIAKTFSLCSQYSA